MKLVDNRKYYNEFSINYEKKRHVGYHALVDELETELLGKYAQNKKILEAGCGTGLLIDLAKRYTNNIFGFDISEKMLNKARKRISSCIQADIKKLPFKSEVFDTVYSFKVLPHIEDINNSLKELMRVLKKDGYLILEFYNPFSFRGIVKLFKLPSIISRKFNDKNVYVRYDNIFRIKKLIPNGMKIVRIRGVRIFTLFAGIFKIPILNNFFIFLERKYCDSFLKYFAGFLIIVLKKD